MKRVPFDECVSAAPVTAPARLLCTPPLPKSSSPARILQSRISVKWPIARKMVRCVDMVPTCPFPPHLLSPSDSTHSPRVNPTQPCCLILLTPLFRPQHGAPARVQGTPPHLPAHSCRAPPFLRSIAWGRGRQGRHASQGEVLLEDVM